MGDECNEGLFTRVKTHAHFLRAFVVKAATDSGLPIPAWAAPAEAGAATAEGAPPESCLSGSLRGYTPAMASAGDEEDWVEVRRFADRIGAEVIRDFLADHDVRVAILGNPQATRMTWSETSDVIRIVVARGDLEKANEALVAMTASEQHPFRGPMPPEDDEEEEKAVDFVKPRSAIAAAALSVILLTGSLRLFDIVEAQNHLGSFLGWNVFRNPVGFVIFSVCVLAETNRAPFDLPEAEQELVAGYHTEYSGMKFGMFFLAEYVNLWVGSLVIVTLFFGGYLIPGEVWFGPALAPALLTVLQVAVFLGKVMFIAFCFIWIRWTLPRFKYNQLMNLGWKYMLPIALANIVVIAALVAGYTLLTQ